MKRIYFIIVLQLLLLPTIKAQVWHSVSGGIGGSGGVYCLKAIDSSLYVGGGFICVGGYDTIVCPGCLRAKCIVKWDGTIWSNPFQGISQLPGAVLSIEEFNDTFYTGGYFTTMWTDPCQFDYLAKYTNDSGWVAVSYNESPNTQIEALLNKDDLYIGGGFNYIGGIPNYNCIAKWNGNNYSKLSNGLFGGFSPVHSLAEYNGLLIAGGGFNYAGDTIAFGIAAWDGQKWYSLDTGLLETVNALAVDTINNFLYAGGFLSLAGGNADMIRVYNLARWDGYEWSPVGSDSGSIFYNGISSLAFYHNYLFAGGYGITGLCSDTLVAKWDGSKWNRIAGMNGTVFCLETYKDELYAGGVFDSIGDSVMYNIARYYETPDTTCDYLQAIIQPRNALLKMSDSTTVHFYNNILHGSSWHWDFGDGGTDSIRMPVHTYTDSGVFNVSVIVTYQNCTDTAYTTITIVDDVGIKDNKSDSTEYLGQNIPNPFDNSTIIPYYVPQGSRGFLQITDAKGELVDEYALQQGKNKLTVSLEYLKAGTYFYSIVIDGKVKQTRKMILE